jgi:hypothetical protein
MESILIDAPESASSFSTALGKIFGGLAELLSGVWELTSPWALLILWLVWWTAGVNWKKLWPVLGKGAWLPLLLLCVLSALVWSRIAPSECCGIPSFWWHLSAVFGLAVAAMLGGWVQGLFNWAPAEIDLNPPAHHHHHDHHHGGGHDEPHPHTPAHEPGE